MVQNLLFFFYCLDVQPILMFLVTVKWLKRQENAAPILIVMALE